VIEPLETDKEIDGLMDEVTKKTRGENEQVTGALTRADETLNVSVVKSVHSSKVK